MLTLSAVRCQPLRRLAAFRRVMHVSVQGGCARTVGLSADSSYRDAGSGAPMPAPHFFLDQITTVPHAASVPEYSGGVAAGP
jgi:hypothetical protein